MGTCSKEEVYQKFLGFYQKDFVSGNVSPCTVEDQVRQGKDFLDSVPTSCQRFQLLDFYRLAQDFLEAESGQERRQELFQALSKAFEVLELISVNLYLWPWRKEIKSIKTFTGAFVYFIQPVFPPDVLQGILEKMGYTQKGTSEYVMSKQVNKEEIGQLGFEFFLARAECELMQEMLDQVMHSGCKDIVQLRSRMPYKQADCIKCLNGMETGSGKLGEGASLGNEGASKSGLHSKEGPAKCELLNMPLPLTDANREGVHRLRVEALMDRESDATNDPLSTSLRLPPDSIDLYREYNDIAISTNYPEGQKLVEAACPGGELEQCDSLLILDELLMQKARAESLVQLSPGQTGPLSWSPFSNSTLNATSSDNKNLKNKDRTAFDSVDTKCSLKHSVLDATSQKYAEDKWSGKSYQKLDNILSIKYGSFLNGNSRKKDYVSAVEIELKNIDKEKLPYPIAETAGPAPFHQANQSRASECQHVGLRHPETTAATPLRQNQTAQQISACQTPSIPECCVCSPTELLGVRPLSDNPELTANTSQESGGQVVREPPQSFYIPPDSLEGRSSLAMTCDVCGSLICPNCSSELTAGECQALPRECLHIQELVVGESPDPYLLVSKLTDRSADLDDDKSMRCNRCKEEEDL
ncbi:uncharacterized protein si:ch211-189a15.5 [Heterodontus francisci]|uniref:uncharacterized protein si:ch211-189a15.5 n=1 Tax=Heterodontus francisci TaxID=7792 RepID=UPI00355C022B